MKISVNFDVLWELPKGKKLIRTEDEITTFLRGLLINELDASEVSVNKIKISKSQDLD